MLYVAGLEMERGKDEAEPINFLPRVKHPVLMLNGSYDFFFPIETSQRPFFEMLGTPADRKRWVVYDGGHNVPREQLISETLDGSTSISESPADRAVDPASPPFVQKVSADASRRTPSRRHECANWWC